jgi:membrane protease YdiL (CAAX protease family)
MAYSNGLGYWAHKRGQFHDTFFHKLNPTCVALMLLYAARRPGGLAVVGLKREGLGKSLLGGLGLGLALSGPPLFFFYKPILLDTPMEYGPIQNLTRRQLLKNLFVDTPVGIAVLEELAFRGLLQAALRKHLPPQWSIIGSSLGFAGWHLTVTATSAAQTNIANAARLPRFLRPFTQIIAVVGGMLTTGVAGLLFGWLRERTGNLGGPMLAHWLVDSLMIAALWLRRPKSTAGHR